MATATPTNEERDDRERTAEAERCPLCGAGLMEEGGGCAACPLHSGCRMRCCSSCGYSTPQGPRWLERLLRRGSR